MIGELTVYYDCAIPLADHARLMDTVYDSLDRVLDDTDFPEWDLTSMTLTEVPSDKWRDVVRAVRKLDIPQVREITYFAYDTERDE